MRTVRVDTGKPYDICIERGILDKCGEYAKALSKAEKVTIISDSNVAPLYMDRVKNSLEKEGLFLKQVKSKSTSALLRKCTTHLRNFL